MYTYLRVLGTNGVDTSPSVILHMGKKRYLFNCGEGTQRMLVEKSMRVSSCHDIFLTRVQWESIGGIPGMLLTLADAGNKDITLHGGPNLTHFLAGTRSFVYRPGISIQCKEYPSSEFPSNASLPDTPVIFQDEFLTVQAVPIYPEGYSPLSSPSSGQTSKRRKVDVDVPMKEGTPISTPSNATPKAAVDDVWEADGGISIPSPPNPMLASAEQVTGQKTTFSVAQEVIKNMFANRSTTSPSVNSSLPSGSNFSILPPTKATPVVLGYICHGPIVPGKFDVLAARKLGIAPGPNFGRLTRGESITLLDGTIIQPHQCVAPTKPGKILIIVDCPSPAYIPSLVASEKYKALAGDIQHPPTCIVHILGKDVLEHPLYQSWMKSFSPKTQHIVSSKAWSSHGIVFQDSARSHAKLTHLSPEVFPLIHEVPAPEKDISSLDLGIPLAESKTGLVFEMEPVCNLSTLDVDAPFVRPSFEGSVPEGSPAAQAILENFLSAAKVAQEDIMAREQEHPFIPGKGNDVVVCTLGTGSSLPSKYRNVSATLLRVPKVGTIFLDAGEGTYGQLWRHLGDSADVNPTFGMSTAEALMDLRCIYISHLHADHHLGVMRLLTKRKELLDARPVPIPIQFPGRGVKRETEATSEDTSRILHIVGPTKMWMWIKEYAQIEDLDLPNLRFTSSHSLLINNSPEDTARQTDRRLFKDLDLKRVTTGLVTHCAFAYGVRMDFGEWTMAFSGDCRPCEPMVALSKDATLLIHEATFEDTMQMEAEQKRHSTTAEAIDVGKRAGAENVLLTHFSQRYPKVPNFSDASENVGVSFDLMSFRIGDMWKLPKILKAVRVLYASGCEEQMTEARGTSE